MKQSSPPTQRARIRGCLLGLALGDCVGAAVEFKARGSFTPLTDLQGGGTWGLEAGQFTDDTSMALCLAESLAECGGFNALDQMQRYLRWWREGYWSSTGRCFDIGATTRAALASFEQTGNPFAGSSDARTAGNGSLMRLAPAVLFHANEDEQALRAAAESSRTTHGAPAAVEGCRLFAVYLLRALQGATRAEVLAPVQADWMSEKALLPIAAGTFASKPSQAIHGSGYVVESLEAALWAFARTESFRAAVLTAANLGDDSDTTAAITGQIAGAFYGEAALPETWLAQLVRRDEIISLADRLADHAGA
jgi:ADP-ribosyl-[dinitrogen reductase] hydrolase